MSIGMRRGRGRGSGAGWCVVAEPTTTAINLQPQSVLSADQRFAVVPEWVLDLPISDAAFRLYAVLARYGNTSGVRMPGRVLLARRLRKSVGTPSTGARLLETQTKQQALPIAADHAPRQVRPLSAAGARRSA